MLNLLLGLTTDPSSTLHQRPQGSQETLTKKLGLIKPLSSCQAPRAHFPPAKTYYIDEMMRKMQNERLNIIRECSSFIFLSNCIIA